jgi:histidinol-phosphate aminotransferase
MNPDVMKCNPYQPGKPIEEVAREMNIDYDSIVKLASNECPLGPSPKAKKAMKAAIDEMHLYPDGGAYFLKNKLAETYDMDPGNFILGNGSNEILEFISLCFLKPGSSAVMSAHAFVIYKILAKMHGAKAIEFPMNGLTHDLHAMAKGVPEDTRVIFVCNPNNPTGSMVNQAQVDSFMKAVPEDALIVFDEAYAEICTKKMPDTLKYVSEGRNVIILRTFSKAYGLAGLRVGYGIAKKEIIELLEKPRQPFNVSRMAQIAAVAALDDQAFVKKVRKLFKDGSDLISDFCRGAGLEFEPPAANFILIKVGDGERFFVELQKLGVIVRPMGGYNLPDWIRVSIGTEEENGKFIRAMGELL